MQVGAKEHDHPKLDGAIDLRNKTDHRQLIRLAWHSCGGLGPVTYLQHLCAAWEKRFVYNSLKSLKPGGIAVHTGEYNLSSDWKTTDYAHTVLWTRYDIEEVLAWLHERGHEAEFDWTVGDEPEDDILNQSDHCHLRLWRFPARRSSNHGAER